jgi:DNA-binding MarR family transcriptional regulator
MHDDTCSAPDRADLEFLINTDLRELTVQSSSIAREFADQNGLSGNELRALLFVMIAETSGEELTAGRLRQRMGLTGGAITYLVERMIQNGHLRRETDPSDRRKVILRYADHGLVVARAFFAVLGERHHSAIADLPDRDLEAAHRTFRAMVNAMNAFRAEIEPRAAEPSTPAQHGQPPPDGSIDAAPTPSSWSTTDVPRPSAARSPGGNPVQAPS